MANSLPRLALRSFPDQDRAIQERNRVTTQIVATKTTDSRIKAVVLIVMAAIIAAGGASLLVTSGGPTNALLFYSGVALEGAALGLIVTTVVIGERARRFNNEKRAEFVGYVNDKQHVPAIYDTITQESTNLDVSVIQSVLSEMKNDEFFSQFSGYALIQSLDQRLNNNQKTLFEALAFEDRFVSLINQEDPSVVLSVVNLFKEVDAKKLLDRLEQPIYNSLLEYALKQPGNDQIIEALVSSQRVVESGPALQRQLLERLSEEKALTLVGRLNEKQYLALVTNVNGAYFGLIEPIPKNDSVLQALASSNHISAMNVDVLLKWIPSLTQEKVVAVFSQLDNQRFSDSVAYIYQIYDQQNEKVKFAIAQRPKDFAAIVKKNQLSVDAIGKTYALMNEAQKAEFIKEVTDRFNATNAVKNREECIKINKIVENCIQKNINEEFAREPLVTQFARWPEHSGKLIATRNLWENGVLLNAYWNKLNEEQKASFAKGAVDLLPKDPKVRAQHWISMIDQFGDNIPLFILTAMHATTENGLKSGLGRILNLSSAKERDTALTQKKIKQQFQDIANS